MQTNLTVKKAFEELKGLHFNPINEQVKNALYAIKKELDKVDRSHPNYNLDFLTNDTVLEGLKNPDVLRYLFNHGPRSGGWNDNRTYLKSEQGLLSNEQSIAERISFVLQNVFQYDLENYINIDEDTIKKLKSITSAISKIIHKNINVNPGGAKQFDFQGSFRKICENLDAQTEEISKLREQYNQTQKVKHPPYGFEFHNVDTLDAFIDKLLCKPDSEFFTELLDSIQLQRFLRAIAENPKLSFANVEYNFQDIIKEILDKVQNTKNKEHNLAFMQIFHCFQILDGQDCYKIVKAQYNHMLSEAGIANEKFKTSSQFTQSSSAESSKIQERNNKSQKRSWGQYFKDIFSSIVNFFSSLKKTNKNNTAAALSVASRETINSDDNGNEKGQEIRTSTIKKSQTQSNYVMQYTPYIINKNKQNRRISL